MKLDGHHQAIRSRYLAGETMAEIGKSYNGASRQAVNVVLKSFGIDASKSSRLIQKAKDKEHRAMRKSLRKKWDRSVALELAQLTPKSRIKDLDLCQILFNRLGIKNFNLYTVCSICKTAKDTGDMSKGSNRVCCNKCLSARIAKNRKTAAARITKYRKTTAGREARHAWEEGARPAMREYQRKYYKKNQRNKTLKMKR